MLPEIKSVLLPPHTEVIPMDRRTFLGLATTAVGTLACVRHAPAQTPIRRVGGPRLKTSLNAYSFHKPLTDHLKGIEGGMTLADLLGFCAEHGFDAIDPTGYYFPGYPDPPANKAIIEFKRRAHELGLDVSGTGVRTHFAAADADRRAADVRHAKAWVEVAARLGAPVLRVFAGAAAEGRTLEEQAEWVADCLREVAAHGAKFGVLIGFQNHWDALGPADDVLKVLKQVESDWLGMVVDVGSFHTADPYKDIAAVVPFAVNWQVKEYLGGGDKEKPVKTDLAKVVAIAREGGYRGSLPIETLPAPGGVYDPVTKVPRLLKELQAAIRASG
jgi:sugar phosphate isomerase/epimerase